MDWAQADGIKLTGEGALLQLLTEKILESALEGEGASGPSSTWAEVSVWHWLPPTPNGSPGTGSSSGR